MRIIITIMLTLSYFIANTAIAQNLFEPSSNDLSLKVLGSLFGGLIEGSNGTDPMLNAIKIFNGGVLIIGGILAGYTILTGTIGTAHDGEMLGKKFSSAWIPIRYSVGTALVLPVVGGGYCVMQAIVMWLVVQGVGLADKVWISYMSNTSQSSDTSINVTGDYGVLKLAENIFAMQVCNKANAQAIAESSPILNYSNLYNFGTSQKDNVIRFGDTKAIINKSACGKVTLPNYIADTVQTNGTTSNTGRLGDIGSIFNTLSTKPIIDAQIKATSTLIAKMDATASKAVSRYDKLDDSVASAIYAEIETGANEYKNTVESASKTLASNGGFDRIKASADNQGWLLAGAWFNKIIDINNKISVATKSISQSKATISTGATDGITIDAGKYARSAGIVLQNSKTAITDTQIKTDGTQEGQKVESGSSIMGDIGASIGEAFTTVNLYALKNDSRHPLIIINDVGDRLITANTIIATSTMIIGFVAGAVSLIAGNGVTSAMSAFNTFFVLPFNALWAVGFGASYVVPNIGFFIWIGCITGWTLLVIEAIIAAPLWAIMHLHPNGDDMTGKGANGYMLVLSLLLRPVLMVFGLITSIIISSVLGELINKIYFEVFAGNNNITGIGGFFKILFGTAIYVVLMFIFMQKCFSIIHKLPDQLLRWIGGGQEHLGQMAEDFAQSSKAGLAGATGFIGGALSASKNGLASKINTLERGYSDNPSKQQPPNAGQSQGTAEDKESNSFSDIKRQNSINEQMKSNEGFAFKFGGQDGLSRYNAELDIAKDNGEDTLEASKAISSNIVNEGIAEKLQDFGADSKLSSFVNRIARTGQDEDGNSLYNAFRANGAIELVERASKKLGSDKANEIAEAVLSNSNEETSNKDIMLSYQKLYKDAFKDIK